MAGRERLDPPGMKVRRGGQSFVGTVPRLVDPGMKVHGDRLVARRCTGRAQRLPSTASMSISREKTKPRSLSYDVLVEDQGGVYRIGFDRPA
jgi:hypothetical protein